MPVLSIDADLREQLSVAMFNCYLQAVERVRLAYVRTLLSQAMHAALLGTPYGQMPAEFYVREVDSAVQLEPEPDLSVHSYLPHQRLFGAPGASSPLLLTPRQWLDLSLRGVPLFEQVGAVRRALLFAYVNI